MQEAQDFKCGQDTSKLFKKKTTLKSKNVTVDRRLTCSSPIETTYYTVQHNVKAIVGKCAFCSDKLDAKSTKIVKNLLDQNHKVLPSCGKPECLSMNPKANFNNGWTIKEKRSRKRKQTTESEQVAKKKTGSGKKGK